MKFKRLLSSFLCAVMLVGTLTVPAFAATSTDASGNTIYVSDNSLNNEVQPLSEAPEMDYTFTFNDVEFSNYVKYEPTYTLDAQNNRIFVARITIGLGGAMKSNKGNVEFMAYPRTFNIIPTYLKGYGADSDLVAYKTNTPYMAKKSGTYSYLNDLYVTPYSDSDRAEDGTWDAGLTWEFNKNPEKVRENGSYLDIFFIRVDQGTKTTYFEVRVTDDTNFFGDRTTSSENKPVEDTSTPVGPVKSYKIEDTYYPNYGFKANSDFVSIDADSVVKGEKASVGNLTSETMQSFPRNVDTYTTTGKTELTMNTNIPFNYIFVYYANSWSDLRADKKTVVSSNGSSAGKTTYTLDKSGVYAVEMMFAEIPAKCTFVVEVSNSGTTETPTTPTTPTAPALKSFKDVAANRWSHDAIMEMVGLGMFSGTTTPDANGVGTFNPTGTMTRAQYIVVVTRYLFNDELNAMEQGDYWYSNNYDLAVKYGLITKTEFPFNSINNPITRQEMALVAVRTAQAQGETMPTLVSTDRIADYSTIGNYYKDFVVKAFSMGLISGYDDKGTFGPNDTLTREQGAMVAYRLVRPDTRKLPETNTQEETTTTTEGAITIKEGQTSSRPAKAGDTYIKADGTKVVLKVGPNGILGEGQGVAPDAGLSVSKMTSASSNFNAQGVFTYNRTELGVLTDSLGKDLQNQEYCVNQTTGEGHWYNEWLALENKYPAPKADGTTNGQLSSDPYNLYYWHARSGSWRTNY